MPETWLDDLDLALSQTGVDPNAEVRLRNRALETARTSGTWRTNPGLALGMSQQGVGLGTPEEQQARAGETQAAQEGRQRGVLGGLGASFTDPGLQLLNVAPSLAGTPEDLQRVQREQSIAAASEPGAAHAGRMAGEFGQMAAEFAGGGATGIAGRALAFAPGAASAGQEIAAQDPDIGQGELMAKAVGLGTGRALAMELGSRIPSPVRANPASIRSIAGSALAGVPGQALGINALNYAATAPTLGTDVAGEQFQQSMQPAELAKFAGMGLGMALPHMAGAPEARLNERIDQMKATGQAVDQQVLNQARMTQIIRRASEDQGVFDQLAREEDRQRTAETQAAAAQDAEREQAVRETPVQEVAPPEIPAPTGEAAPAPAPSAPSPEQRLAQLRDIRKRAIELPAEQRRPFLQAQGYTFGEVAELERRIGSRMPQEITRPEGQLEAGGEEPPKAEGEFIVGLSGLGSHFSEPDGNPIIDKRMVGNTPAETTAMRESLAALERAEAAALRNGTPFPEAHRLGNAAQAQEAAKHGFPPGHIEGLIDARLKLIEGNPQFSHPVRPEQLHESGAADNVVRAGSDWTSTGEPPHARQVRSDEGQIQETGVVGPSREGQGRTNLQRAAEARPGAGHPQGGPAGEGQAPRPPAAGEGRGGGVPVPQVAEPVDVAGGGRGSLLKTPEEQHAHLRPVARALEALSGGKTEFRPDGSAVHKLPGGRTVAVRSAADPDARAVNPRNWLASVTKNPDGAATALRAIFPQHNMSEAQAREWIEKNIKTRLNRNGVGTTEVPSAELAKVIDANRPVAALVEGKPVDADHLVRVFGAFKNLKDGKADDAAMEEVRQLMWRLMPDADRAAAMKGMGRADDPNSAGAEEAFAQHLASMRPTELKAAPGWFRRSVAAVVNVLRKLIPWVRKTDLVPEDQAAQVFAKAQRGGYLQEKAPAEAAQRPINTQPAGGERFATSTPQDFAKAVHEQNKPEVKPDEAVRDVVQRRMAALGGVQDQRAEASRIAARAAAGEGITDEDVAFMNRVQAEAHQSAGSSTEALGTKVAMATARNIVAGRAGAALRQARYEYNTPEGRRAAIQVELNTLRGHDYAEYEQAIKDEAKAAMLGDASAAEAAKAKQRALESKGADMAAKRRATFLRKYGVDLHASNLGDIIDERYATNLVSTIRAHRTDFSVADILSATFIENTLSHPSTWAKFIGSNALNGLWTTVGKNSIMATLNGVTGGKMKGPEFGEVGAMMKGLGRGWQSALANARKSWAANHDVLEESLLGSAGSLTPAGRGGDSPDLFEALTGLPWLKRVSTGMVSFHDALFKTWSAYAHVGAEAYQHGKGQGLSGDALSRHIDQIMADPHADTTGSWQRAYSKARETTMQEAHDDRLTDQNIQNILRGISHLSRTRVGFGRIGNTAIDIQPLVFMLPFLHTPAMVLRQGVRYIPPVQVARTAYHLCKGDFRASNPERGRQILDHAAHLAVGSALWWGAQQLVNNQVITGSDAEWNTPEGQAQREGSAIAGYMVKMPWGWQSYKNLEPFSRGLAALVDHAQGRSAVSIGKSQMDAFLLNQIHDLAQVTEEPGGQKSSRLVATTLAGIAVPNLFRRGISQARQASEGGAYRPIQDTMRRSKQDFAQNTKENFFREATGGLVGQNPIRVDYWGRNVTHAPDSVGAMLTTQMMGLGFEQDRRTAWDLGFAKWNDKAREGGHPDLVWNPYKTVDSFKDHGVREPLTLQQLAEVQKIAGPERLRRFNNSTFDPNNLTVPQVKVLRRIDQEVDAWAIRRMMPELRASRAASPQPTE